MTRAQLQLWHLTHDAARAPRRVSAGQGVQICAGTWPIGPHQSVWMLRSVARGAGRAEQRIELVWQRNAGSNSYWSAAIGPFGEGEEIHYTLHARDDQLGATSATYQFRVGPQIHLALLWHHHQPFYPAFDRAPPRCPAPWVRLHALRDYYSMAALLSQQPRVHATFNFTPSLLYQLESYVLRGARDRALELTLTSAENLTRDEREELLGSFFDAQWHHQVFRHPRYRALFEMRARGERFSAQDLRDLQMWFNLAWFGSEFRAGVVELVTGEHASVRRLVEQGHGFTPADIEDMVDQQQRILRAIIPLHRALQEQGQIEVSTTPFAHPILPLLMDTDDATIDRAGTTHPTRFSWAEDAEAHVRSACEAYRRWFGRNLRGMWPAEGAVSERCIGTFQRAGLQWIATDRGVLALSGRWGYDVARPEVLCQARRAMDGSDQIAMFFRDTALSDAIGFRYGSYASAEAAVSDLIEQIRHGFIERIEAEGDHVLSVILDGENAWGDYPDDGRPFLNALYRRLAELDAEIRTVTFSEWLEGNAARGVQAHPLAAQERVFDLFTGSWIDESGSAPGVDLGTWIGEQEENRAWELLGRTRRWLAERGATPESAPAAFFSLYAAEGSDWFWWYGADQDSGKDGQFDAMFREHLAQVYRAGGGDPPRDLELPIVAEHAVWTFSKPVCAVARDSRLLVRTNCPGCVRWTIDAGPWVEQQVVPVGGVMAGARYHQVTLGPFPQQARRLRFEFHCQHLGCDGRGLCCQLGQREVEVI